jgi:hypothetical protein
MISPVLVQNIQYGTYILWAGLNLSFIPIIYFFSTSPPPPPPSFHRATATATAMPPLLDLEAEP